MTDTQARTGRNRTSATQEGLPLAAEAMPAILVPTTGQAAKNGHQARPETVGEPGRKDGAPPAPQVGGFASAWRKTWTFLFNALREFYWVLDRDSKIRSQGLQTVGRVLGTRTEKHSDPESATYYTHHVRYEYQIDGVRHGKEKSVGSLANLKKGVPIKVYYLPGTSPPDSALDRGARALSEGEVRRLEASPVQAEMGYSTYTNGGGPR